MDGNTGRLIQTYRYQNTKCSNVGFRLGGIFSKDNSFKSVKRVVVISKLNNTLTVDNRKKTFFLVQEVQLLIPDGVFFCKFLTLKTFNIQITFDSPGLAIKCPANLQTLVVISQN